MTGPPSLSFDSQAPPELLHQRGREQIFLTDWSQDDDGVTFAARLPLEHPRYTDTPNGFHDILVIAEAITQVGMTASVNLLGVPPDFEFFSHTLEASLDPLENNARGPDSVRLTLAAGEGTAGVKFRPDGSSSGAFLSTRNRIEGRPSGESKVKAFWMPAERYREFRSRTRKRRSGVEEIPQGLEPETLTGREDPANSVVSTVESSGHLRYACCLIVDTSDPTFYDRPFDHVSGLLFCEGARQAATAAACRELGLEPAELVVTALEMKFLAFAELDDLTRCGIALAEGACAAGIEFTQSGRPVCRAEVRTAIL